MKEKAFKKVLVLGDDFPDSFGDNISSTLNKMDIENVLYNPILLANTKNAILRISGDYLLRFVGGFDALIAKKTLKCIQRINPDLIISTNAKLPPRIVEEIKKKTKIKVTAWFTDAVSNLGRQYLLAAPYDVLFLKEPYMVDLFKSKMGLRTFYLPEAMNPLWHTPPNNFSKEECSIFGSDLSIVGNMYYSRAKILEKLEKYDMKIWGPRFPSWLDSSVRKKFTNKYVVKSEKSKVFYCSKINLNNLNPAEIYGVNCKAFEIAGCGGFQIIEYRREIEKLFDIEKEIVTYNTLNELEEKVKYYLSNPEERKKIAANSLRRALKDHTYENRLLKLFEVVAGLE